MEFNYIAYTEGNKLINGSVTAATEKAASERLTKLGYRVLTLKLVTPLMMDISKLFPSKSKVKADTVITFSRQMATLINAGVNAVTCLELIQAQTVEASFKWYYGKSSSTYAVDKNYRMQCPDILMFFLHFIAVP
jgi:type II secretory pathway component PulF